VIVVELGQAPGGDLLELRGRVDDVDPVQHAVAVHDDPAPVRVPIGSLEQHLGRRQQQLRGPGLDVEDV
jgi:hypothetical protein